MTKSATDVTLAAFEALRTKLPPESTQDFEDAKRGFIAGVMTI